MAVTLISNSPPYTFGQQSNQVISRLIGLNTQIVRVEDAIATASSGFTGTEGTEFEVQPINSLTPTVPNLFGVVASDVPGDQGKAYRFAFDSLNSAWAAFWAQARPFIEQLDNGNNTL